MIVNDPETNTPEVRNYIREEVLRACAYSIGYESERTDQVVDIYQVLDEGRECYYDFPINILNILLGDNLPSSQKNSQDLRG